MVEILLKQMEKNLRFSYPSVTADSGYESEEAYDYLSSKEQKPYIKPQTYEKWKKRNFKQDISKRENMKYDKAGDTYTADETYIKIRGVKAYIWFIMDAAKRSIIGYQVSDNRGVGPCILAMRMAFRHLKQLPEKFRFIADGYSAYPLAAQQFFREFGDAFKFDITQVIGLTNDDAVSKEFRPFKQMIERLNRTYKVSYRSTNGFDNIEGANYDLALWVAYYNFLRPHPYTYWKPLNELKEFDVAENMPAKWQILIKLGQDKIYQMQQASA